MFNHLFKRIAVSVIAILIGLSSPITALASVTDTTPSQNIKYSTSQITPISLSATSTNTSTISPNSSAFNTAILNVSGTWTGTFVIEGTADGGTTWSTLQGVLNEGTTAPIQSVASFSNSTATTFTYHANVAGYNQIRARVTTAGTGTIVITGTLSPAPYTPLNLVSNNDVTYSGTVQAGTQFSHFAIPLNGASTVGISWTNNSTNAILQFQASVDGVNYVGIVPYESNTLNPYVSTISSLSFIGRVSVAGYSYFRISNQSATGSVGTNTININCTVSPHTAITTLVDPLPTGTNTIGAVTQSSGPWTQNLTYVNGVAIGSPTAAGTSTSGNVLGVQGTTGGVPVQVGISDAATTAAGIFALINPYGNLRVSHEPTALFTDSFDGTVLDTTNRWNTPSTVGSGTVTVNNGSLLLSTGTTASNAATLKSQPSFVFNGLGYSVFGNTVKLEAATPYSNVYRFWGEGTQPTSFTYSAPVQDGVGFETLGNGTFNAVVYAGGTKIFSSSLTPKTDGAFHRYGVFVRSDAVFWYVDAEDVPVAVANYMTPNYQTLPLLFEEINNTTAPSTAPVFTVGATALSDSTSSNAQISDGTYPWRKATVSSVGALSTQDNLTQIGSSTFTTTTKSVQPTSGNLLPVQEEKDSGRSYYSMVYDNTVPTLSTTEALLTTTQELNGVLLGAGNSFGVGIGVFRLQHIAVTAQNGAVTAGSCLLTLRLRVTPSGTLTTASTEYMSFMLSFYNVGSTDREIHDFPDGVEFPLGSSFGIGLVVNSTTTCSNMHLNIALLGYEY